MGKAVEFILGITIEVAQFDKARQRHKQWPKNNFYFEEYMDKLADMETKVSKQQHQFRDQLAQWKREFFVKNNCKVATQDLHHPTSSIKSTRKAPRGQVEVC